MSLQDKDRIFTNVYGFQPWSLASAKKRGDWDGTKALLTLGPDAILEALATDQPVKVGPQIARQASCPEGEATTLLGTLKEFVE